MRNPVWEAKRRDDSAAVLGALGVQASLEVCDCAKHMEDRICQLSAKRKRRRDADTSSLSHRPGAEEISEVAGLAAEAFGDLMALDAMMIRLRAVILVGAGSISADAAQCVRITLG
ncbi:MAG: hypothetical protein ACRYG8_10790 [Janthinobacterium lividum]